MKSVDKNIIRELYYSIEDFYRVGASEYEIIAHIQISLEMLKIIRKKKEPISIITKLLGTQSKNGTHIPTADLFCIAYPHQDYHLQKILDILESYEVTLSRLERSGLDILICRITKNDKALTEATREKLIKKLKQLGKKEKPVAKKRSKKEGETFEILKS